MVHRVADLICVKIPQTSSWHQGISRMPRIIGCCQTSPRVPFPLGMNRRLTSGLAAFRSSRAAPTAWCVLRGKQASRRRRWRSPYRHERCDRLVRLHPGGMVESHTLGGMGDDGANGNFLQFPGGLQRAPKRGALPVRPACRGLDFVFVIADIESPQGGVIRVHPQNLLTAAETLKRQ